MDLLLPPPLFHSSLLSLFFVLSILIISLVLPFPHLFLHPMCYFFLVFPSSSPFLPFSCYIQFFLPSLGCFSWLGFLLSLSISGYTFSLPVGYCFLGPFAIVFVRSDILCVLPNPLTSGFHTVVYFFQVSISLLHASTLWVGPGNEAVPLPGFVPLTSLLWRAGGRQY